MIISQYQWLEQGKRCPKWYGLAYCVGTGAFWVFYAYPFNWIARCFHRWFWYLAKLTTWLLIRTVARVLKMEPPETFCAEIRWIKATIRQYVHEKQKGNTKETSDL
jgi:hypothetical protein